MKKTRKPKPWFVYMVRCADSSLYTGITKNVTRRCQQHNAGIASRYTRSRRPVRLVYQEAAASRSSALKREVAIKAMTKREKEAMIGGASRKVARTGCQQKRIGSLSIRCCRPSTPES